MPPKTVFLDSSVLFTAVNSPFGGSAKLFTYSQTKLKLITSKLVLTEVERNIRKKLENYHLERFFMLVDKMKIINKTPGDGLIKKAKKVIVEKDALILAEAKQARVKVLVTLDKKHFLTKSVVAFLRPQKVLIPKDLLTELNF